MLTKHQYIPVFVLIMTIGFATYLAAGQGAPAPQQEPAVDFSNAGIAEVRDDRRQVILRGQFTTPNTDPNKIERKATLTSAGIDVDAAGEAEVEVSGSGNRRRQEVEFDLKNLQPGGVFTLAIDGRDFATVTADSRGRAEHERDVPLPGTASR
jgi:hypothetical protein